MPRLLVNSLILLGAAVLVLAGMAGYVKLTQFHSSPEDNLKLSVPEDIIWPWQQVDLWIDYSRAEGQVVVTKQAPGPLVFVIDTSGSMSEDDLTEAKRAILDMQLNVGNEKGVPPIAIVNFANRAKVVIGLTRDTAELKNALINMARDVGGGTAFTVGLNKVIEVLRNAPGATVIMLTDGHAGESNAALRSYYNNTWSHQGHSLFMIGIGEGGVNTASFQELTDDPAQFILAGLDRNAISRHFVEAASRMGNVFGRNARVQLHLAEPLWTSDIPEDVSFTSRRYLSAIDADDGSYFLPVLFQRSYQWAVRLTPKFGGVLSTLADTPSLTYVDRQGDTKALQGADGSPKVLAITPWLLFLLLLPLILYWLAALLTWLLRKPAEKVPSVETKRGNKTSPPANLPLRPLMHEQRIHWTPTLVIGLGGSGREVLTHLKQNMLDCLDKEDTRPVLLAMDVAREEMTGSNRYQIPGCMSELSDEQQFILPTASCDLTQLVHQSFAIDHPAAELDLLPYKNSSTDVLRLSKGSLGHRTLARLALLNDLSMGGQGALLQRLQQALSQWRLIQPEQQIRQIQLVANVDGGVGSGWLIDLVILLRRLVAEDEQKGHAVEIVLVLQGESSERRGNLIGLNAPYLFSELNRLATAGKQKFNHCLACNTDQSVLDGWVRSRPQDAVYIVPTATPEHRPAVADVLGFLLDQKRRTEVAHTLQAMQGEEVRIRAEQGVECYTQVAVQNATYPQSFFEQLQINQLEQLIVSEQVLFVGLQQQQGDILLKETLPEPGLLLDSVGGGQIRSPVAQLMLSGHVTSQLSAETVVNEIQQTRLNFIDNTNIFLAKRKIGLFGLQQFCHDFSCSLKQSRDDVLGDSEVTDKLNELAEQLEIVAKQAVTWIELCLGSTALKANGLTSVTQQAVRKGMLVEAATAHKEVRQRLSEWAKTPSRLLVNPAVSGLDPLKNPASEDSISSLLARQFKSFLARWLPATQDQIAALTARCYWQLSTPGLNGEAIGIQLVFRASQTHHFKPEAEDMAQFRSVLHDEAIRVLAQADQVHILSLLQQNQQMADDSWFATFAQNLKGDLSGEKSHLLVSVPQLYLSQGALGGFRAKMKKTFADDMSGSTEIVRLHDSSNSSSVSIFQAQPLMEVDTSVSGKTKTGHLPVHRPERLLQTHSKVLAVKLGLELVDLPSATAIALNNQGVLREFAELYFDGQVKIHPVTQLWQFNTGNHWQNITNLPLLTLADAAACYVTDWQGQGCAERIHQTPCPDTTTNDFVELLEQLLNNTKDK